MLRNRIGFAIWAVLVILYFVATRSFLSAIFLLGTITVLLFSYVSVVKSKNGLTMQFLAPEKIKVNKKKSIKLSLHNTSAYPVFYVGGSIVCENQTTKTKEEIPFKTSLKAYMKEELPFNLRSEEEGSIVVTIKDVVVRDMIGIFVYQPEVSATVTVLVENTNEQQGEQIYEE